ncbi:MAG TPA: LamG domain-containing protein, partial [Candidatus Binatia bacterium]|nr:LamG domain-containing protein [Candidatus Binatia bacterium]
TPATPLADGAHTATVTFNDDAVPANSYTNSWSFSVLANLPLVAFWQFNEQPAGNMVNTNAGAILDASGNGHNGTAMSLATTPIPMNYVAGDAAHGSTPALQFNLLNTNNVTVPDAAGAFNFNFDQSFTVEALIQTTNGGQANVGAIVGKVPSVASAAQWWWRINGGKQQFLVNNGSSQPSVSGSTLVTNGAWHYLAAVYDGAAKQLRLYVDGVSDGNPASVTFTSGVIGNSTNLCIGEFIGTGNRVFNGNMDFVRITAAALDPSWFVQPGTARAPGPLQLSNMAWTAGHGSFAFATGTGHSYLVQSATNLLGPWVNVESVTGNGANATVNLPTTDPQAFFRIVEY